jgi:hypothetical protein
MAMAIQPTQQCNLKLKPEARARLRELSRVTGRRPASVIEHLLALAAAKPGADLLLSMRPTGIVRESEGGPNEAE